uniref:Uncharacterized protein n=1 Tax=CrAss-like virus sp. ctYsL76 TaxID=2826826 RepID=A0A8S5QMP3_9CAUD|nr:MAG TPA: hypothetical protein [CrAss-like virus sp. ctYsL76]
MYYLLRSFAADYPISIILKHSSLYFHITL